MQFLKKYEKEGRDSLLCQFHDTKKKRDITFSIFIDGFSNQLRTCGNAGERKINYLVNGDIREYHYTLFLETLRESMFLYNIIKQYGVDISKDILYRYCLLHIHQVDICIASNENWSIIAKTDFGVLIHEGFIGLHRFEECFEQFSTNFLKSKDETEIKKSAEQLKNGCENSLIHRAGVLFYIQCYNFSTEIVKNQVIQAAKNIIDSPLEPIIANLKYLKATWDNNKSFKGEHIIEVIDYCLTMINNKDQVIMKHLVDYSKNINWQNSPLESKNSQEKNVTTPRPLTFDCAQFYQLHNCNWNYKRKALCSYNFAENLPPDNLPDPTPVSTAPNS